MQIGMCIKPAAGFFVQHKHQKIGEKLGWEGGGGEGKEKAEWKGLEVYSKDWKIWSVKF